MRPLDAEDRNHRCSGQKILSVKFWNELNLVFTGKLIYMLSFYFLLLFCFGTLGLHADVFVEDRLTIRFELSVRV